MREEEEKVITMAGVMKKMNTNKGKDEEFYVSTDDESKKIESIDDLDRAFEDCYCDLRCATMKYTNGVDVNYDLARVMKKFRIIQRAMRRGNGRIMIEGK